MENWKPEQLSDAETIMAVGTFAYLSNKDAWFFAEHRWQGPCKMGVRSETS